ncbi:tail length tape measure protein [Rhizobium leguminosarum]|uniref:phage tail length tape measure family protein n=1 Tax=Rhizobium leguminosarum TaxID=384 RepID=UPI000FEC4971|nr:phage tail length tape measure family protein [Rhizobium leguminosarum]RWX28961.1 tail length tape measure protein [Rhizobium leguminosarum]
MADNTDDLIISISTDQATLRRSIKRIEQDLGTLAGSVQKQFSAVGKSIDNSVSSTLQNRINGMVGIGTKAAKEWTGALADQGKELERLRAQYNPLFATINNYKTAVADIKRAHAIGAISANEMATAISKERQAALASTAAIKGRNAALEATPAQRGAAGGGAFQTANIAAQFQDIAVQLQGGSKPLTIALQQGTQLASVFQTMGSGRQIIAGLGAAFASLVSPVSLVTIGLIAAGGAAYQYFSSVGDGGKKSEEALKKEAELIQSVAQKWGDVLPELKKYAEERQKLVDTKEQKDAVAAAASQQWDDLRKNLGKTQAQYAEFLQTFNDQAADTAKVGALQKAFKDLSEGIAAGNATSEQAKAVQTALLALMQETGIKAVGDFAKTFDGLASSIAGARTEADKLKSSPLFNENIDKSRLPTLGTIGPVYSDNGKLITDPNEIDRYNKQQQENRNPTIDTGRGLPVPVPTPTAKPIQLGEEPNKQAETAATKAANAYRDLIKSADDRIGQVQQEIDLLGKYGVEADAARFALDLMQASEDKGRSLSEQQRKEIEKKVALYKEYSEALSKAKLSQDLLQQQRFNSLSKEDQKITTTLRQYGLPEDLNSDQASQIRKSLKLDDLRSDLHSFADDFKSSLLNNGGDIGKAFADAIQNALMNQASKMLDKIFDQLISGILGTSGGAGAAAGGAIGSVAGAITGKAPVGAVTRSALPDIGASTDVASYIAQAAAKRGIDPATALAVAKSEGGLNSWNMQSLYKKNGVQEQSFGPFQLYKGGGLGNEFMRKTGMDPALASNGPAGVDFALDHASKNGWGAWYGAGKAGISDWQGIGANPGVDSASAALEKLAGSAGTATQGLGSLGSGLGQLGSSLGGAPATSGGGIFGWLSGLLGGTKTGGAVTSAFNTRGYAGGGLIHGPGGPTDDSIPAMLSNEEFVVNARQSKKHRALLRAINNGTIKHFATGGLVSPRLVSAPQAPSLSPRGGTAANDNSAPGVLQVQIVGANGDDHVRMLVKQGVGEGLSQYNENQRRGGFGQMQNRYTAQKG